MDANNASDLASFTQSLIIKHGTTYSPQEKTITENAVIPYQTVPMHMILRHLTMLLQGGWHQLLHLLKLIWRCMLVQ